MEDEDGEVVEEEEEEEVVEEEVINEHAFKIRSETTSCHRLLSRRDRDAAYRKLRTRSHTLSRSLALTHAAKKENTPKLQSSENKQKHKRHKTYLKRASNAPYSHSHEPL